jgi:hypothetical protein
VNLKSSRDSESIRPAQHRGSQIQRLPARACAVDRTVRPVHGSTVDRPFKTKGYAIRAARARSDGPGRVQAMGGGDVAGERRRAAGARRRWPWTALPATSPTTG